MNIKNQTYYIFDDMINTEDFDPNLLKIDWKPYKNIDIYYNGYIIVKDFDYVKINNVSPLHLIISEVGGYIKEKSGGKYLLFDSANENNEVLKKYAELCYVIKNEIETINGGKKGGWDKDLWKSNLILMIICH